MDPQDMLIAGRRRNFQVIRFDNPRCHNSFAQQSIFFYRKRVVFRQRNDKIIRVKNEHSFIQQFNLRAV
jgi:hypothetical protein